VAGFFMAGQESAAYEPLAKKDRRPRGLLRDLDFEGEILPLRKKRWGYGANTSRRML
jgi:hypothetical protein